MSRTTRWIPYCYNSAKKRELELENNKKYYGEKEAEIRFKRDRLLNGYDQSKSFVGDPSSDSPNCYDTSQEIPRGRASKVIKKTTSKKMRGRNIKIIREEISELLMEE